MREIWDASCRETNLFPRAAQFQICNAPLPQCKAGNPISAHRFAPRWGDDQTQIGSSGDGDQNLGIDAGARSRIGYGAGRGRAVLRADAAAAPEGDAAGAGVAGGAGRWNHRPSGAADAIEGAARPAGGRRAAGCSAAVLDPDQQRLGVRLLRQLFHQGFAPDQITRCRCRIVEGEPGYRARLLRRIYFIRRIYSAASAPLRNPRNRAALSKQMSLRTSSASLTSSMKRAASSIDSKG